MSCEKFLFLVNCSKKNKTFLGFYFLFLYVCDINLKYIKNEKDVIVIWKHFIGGIFIVFFF
ncbi:hypothetical protein EDL98_02485 [Ornithobacterium rhinotracheale]|nr:hypothetical protein [Ornithobacterium rhinotracheale]